MRLCRKQELHAAAAVTYHISQSNVAGPADRRRLRAHEGTDLGKKSNAKHPITICVAKQRSSEDPLTCCSEVQRTSSMSSRLWGPAGNTASVTRSSAAQPDADLQLASWRCGTALSCADRFGDIFLEGS